MARPRKPQWEPISRRAPGTGSLSRDPTTGDIRARLPAEISPTRRGRSFKAHELAAAVRWLDDAVRRSAGAGHHTDRTAFADWADYWLETAIEPFKPPTTIRAYVLHLKRAEGLWALALGDIRVSHVRREIGRLASRLAASTVQGTASVWRQCFEAAIDEGLIDRNPVRRFALEGDRQKARTLRRGWTAKETRQLWAAIRGHRFEGGYALVLGCGLRLGEAMGLAWADVDLEGRRAWIHQQWTMHRHRATLKGKNPHWIPLPEPVVAALIRHRDRQPPGAALVWERETTGRPWGETLIRTEWKRLVAGAGLPAGVLHSGRHGLASLLRGGGIPVEAVAELLGHASPGATWTYTHSEAESIEAAMRLVENLLDGDE